MSADGFFAGWIVAGILAAMMLLAVAFRTRLLAAFGLELNHIEPPSSANGEARGATADRHAR